MTNEEAVAHIKAILPLLYVTVDRHVALKMAIEALRENDKLKEEIEKLKRR